MSRGADFVQRLARRWVGDQPFVVVLPGDRVVAVNGASRATSPLVLTVDSWSTVLSIARDAPLTFGEAWMDGRIALERGTLRELLFAIGRSLPTQPRRRGPLAGLARLRDDLLVQTNAPTRSRSNVGHHYDLSLELYRKFLDADLQYSCAYFARPDMTLEEAQAAKKRLIAAKLLIQPGMRLLDIGCGWGGLGLTLAEDHGARVEGVTLSREQLALARERAEQRGLADRARFDLVDYRAVEGPYDRIVSVGMFEHVGRPNYDAYFQAIARLLTEDGVALVHSIGRADPSRPSQPWMEKYVFPGGYVPALSEVLPAVERAGLIVADCEIWRLHYAETLRCWQERFHARRGEIAALYDERFCRMWDFYLAGSETAFRFNNHMVFQLQLTKRLDAVPNTRGYLAEVLRELEAPATITEPVPRRDAA